MASARGEVSELRSAIGRYRKAFWTIAALSGVLNVLLLAGSIYMMMVYDSVLPSHSIPTLFGLLILLAFVYVMQGLFDQMRSRLLGDVGVLLDRQLSHRVQTIISQAPLLGKRFPGDGLTPMRDLDQVRGFLTGSGPIALIDLPWVLFFLAVLTLLHYWLGFTALVGALVMLGLTWLTNRATKDGTAAVSQIAARRNGAAEETVRHVELYTALGMRERMHDRWQAINADYMAQQNVLARSVGTLSGISKISRLFLQSLILTVGALLVIDGKASGGVIFASSILAGRALAPIDSAIANWRGFAAARLGWRRLEELLRAFPADDEPQTLLPPPRARLTVESVVVAPPGTQTVTVQGVEFTLDAGAGLGIIGPSAAGKSSLGRALIGLWKPVRGAVKLDGAALDQYQPERLGRSIGYLPQTVELIEGTIFQNIARFDPDATSEAVIAAARAAAVHDMIVTLPGGYDSMVGVDGAQLSAGQRQRIGLARALYGDPFLVLLDEPNSNLDTAGDAALEQAIAGVRARGGIAIIIAHRPSVLSQVDQLLLLQAGRMVAFGPKEEVLARVMPKPQAIDSAGTAPKAKRA
jgi:ATP-binding cassette subfamily C protein